MKEATPRPDELVRRPPSVWIIYSVTLTGITVNTLISPGIPDILDGLGAPRSLAGLLIAAATFPGIFLAPTAGILADRYGRREVIVPCLVLYGVAGGLAAAAPNFWILVALRLLQGAGSAGLINLAVVLIGDHWHGEQRAKLIGRNAAVLTISVAVLPPIGGGITDLIGWRGPFVVYPVALVTAVAALKGLPKGSERSARLADQLREAAPYLRSPSMIGMVVAAVVIFVLIFGLLLTLMPIYVQEEFGLGASIRGVILGMPAVTSTILALSLGRLVLRFGRRPLLVVAPLFFAGSLAVVAWTPWLGLLFLAVLVFGIGEGILIPGLQDLATSIAPASSRGTTVAVWVGSARLGQTIGPLAASFALGAIGARPAFAAGAGAAAALSLLLATGIRRFGNEETS